MFANQPRVSHGRINTMYEMTSFEKVVLYSQNRTGNVLKAK
jgi:hypothetical protein